MGTIVNPWKNETELWPLPLSIPAEVAATFPGSEAVELLVQSTRANFSTDQEARESAFGFVNHRRRLLAEEYGKSQLA